MTGTIYYPKRVGGEGSARAVNLKYLNETGIICSTITGVFVQDERGVWRHSITPTITLKLDEDAESND